MISRRFGADNGQNRGEGFCRHVILEEEPMPSVMPSRVVKKFETDMPAAFAIQPAPYFGLQDAHSITHTQRQRRAEQTEVEGHMDWKRLLAYITGSVDQELLLRNEYLVTENRILRNQVKGCVHLSDGERKTLAEIGKKLGKQALEQVATIVKPDTILAWHHRLVAKKFEGSR
jgi:hypothetical protein